MKDPDHSNRKTGGDGMNNNSEDIMKISLGKGQGSLKDSGGKRSGIHQCF